MDDRLLTLLSLPGPSGDEGAVAAWLQSEAMRVVPGAACTRIGDNLVIVRGGAPRTAVFAHTDTTGYTLGYDHALVAIGGPDPRDKDVLRDTATRPDGCITRGQARLDKTGGVCLAAAENAEPGTRWIYDRPVKITDKTIKAPYLDNRAGVFCALQALERCESIAVAFTTGEESSGHGARVCAQWLHTHHQIAQALIADLTWHTKDTPCGNGVVVSLRDGSIPRQTLVERVLRLAGESGIAFQKEVQRAGGSDGSHLLRSSVPIDWVFVGAPEKNPHTSRESVRRSDLAAMADLLTFLVNRL